MKDKIIREVRMCLNEIYNIEYETPDDATKSEQVHYKLGCRDTRNNAYEIVLDLRMKLLEMFEESK